jgi:hypothetical protein
MSVITNVMIFGFSSKQMSLWFPEFFTGDGLNFSAGNARYAVGTVFAIEHSIIVLGLIFLKVKHLSLSLSLPLPPPPQHDLLIFFSCQCSILFLMYLITSRIRSIAESIHLLPLPPFPVTYFPLLSSPPLLPSLALPSFLVLHCLLLWSVLAVLLSLVPTHPSKKLTVCVPLFLTSVT